MIATILFLFGAFWTILSIVVGLFALWKKMRLERITSEEELLDKVLIATIGGVVVTRILLFLFSQPLFAKFVSISNGLSLTTTIETVVVVVSFFLLRRFTQEEWKDGFEILDYLCVPLTLFLAFLSLGMFLTSVIAVIFTQTQPNPPPILFQDFYWLFPAVFYFILSPLLAFFERNYRTFLWYRHKRSSAQTGFVTAVFCIAYGIFGATIGWQQPSVMRIGDVPVEPFLRLLVMVSGFVILYVRSGRGSRSRVFT